MNKKTTMKWLCAVTGRAKLLVALLALLQSVLGASGIAFALLLRRTINTAVSGEPDGFRACCLLLALVLLGQILLGALNRFLDEYTTAKSENRFKQRLFSSLLTGDYASVTAVHSGEWMNRLTSDTTVAAVGVTQIVPELIGMLVRLIGALAAILWLEPRFLYILIPGGILVLGLTYGMRKILKRLHKRIQEADGRLRVFMQERLESLLILRSFVQEGPTARQGEELMGAHKAARMKRSNFSNLCSVGFAGAMNGMYLLGIGFCGYGILAGTMSYGNLMAIVQLIGQVQSPFANLTGVLPKYFAMIASAERLMEAEAFRREEEAPLPEGQTLAFYETAFKAIRLEGAGFTYHPPVQAEGEQPSMPMVLRNVNLEIKKGDYVAFTGPSGCGKSTVLKLLMCLYPLDAGSRTLETAGGAQPLTPAWRSLFAYVPQGNQLLSGTIREVVAFGDPEKARDEAGLYRALGIACAEEFVRALEKGLDTPLGERGAGLSEGQMQRIAIARAVYSEHPILMLDEATSALDDGTALRLLENLRRMTDKTVLMVTHRSSHTGIFDKELRFSQEGIRTAATE